MDVAKGVVGHFMNYNKSDIWSQTYDRTVWYIGPVCGKPNQKIFMRNQRLYQRFHLKSLLKLFTAGQLKVEQRASTDHWIR